MAARPAPTAVLRTEEQELSGPERSTRDPLDVIRDPALHRAASRILEQWSADSDKTLSIQDVIFELIELGRTIEAESPPPGLQLEPAALVLRGHILQELRSAVVREWSSASRPNSRKMIEILQGFERAEAMLAPTPTDDLAKRLSDPGGLGLLIEVAHDLRSPLTSILFLAETLLRGQSGGLNEVQQRQLGIIYSAALSLVSTASDVIEIARGGERIDGVDPAPFSLTGVMEPVRDIVHPMAEEKGVSLRIFAAEPDQRLGFAVSLSRVLLNLTTNALKFTSEGFVEIVAKANGPSRIEFSVRDSGSGIAPEALRTLFHPFRRRSGNGGGYYFSGTGLGLTICQKLVHSMGGELHVETQEGFGTRFFFEIEAPPAR